MPLCTLLPPLHARLSSSLERHKSLLETLEREGRRSDRDALKQEEETLRKIEEEITALLKEEGLSHLLENDKRMDTAFLETLKQARVLDESFGEKGVVRVALVPLLVKDYASAEKAFKEADEGSASSSWGEWGNVPYEAPPAPSFEAVILSYNHDEEMRKSSDKIVEDMERLGLRPPTLAETFALGITHPELTQFDNTYFNSLTKYQVDGGAHVPGLYRGGGLRRLGGFRWTSEWDSSGRFLAVRI